MSKFRFRLQRVLRVREHIEHGRARDVGRAREELDRRETALQDIAFVRENVRSSHSSHGMVAAGRAALLNFVLDRLQQDAEEAERAYMAAQKDFEVALQRHAQARQDREALSRLRTKQHKEWTMEESRLEQKEIDEVARVMTFARR